jgi:hypothetical protein
MIACPEHGDFDELTPFPGQGLKYCVLVSKNESYTLIGPLNTEEAIARAKHLAASLGYRSHGEYSMASIGDLQAWADAAGLGRPTPPPDQSRLPRSLIPAQDHELGCLYAEQGHPGKCYIPEPVQGFDVSTGRSPQDDWLQ